MSRRAGPWAGHVLAALIAGVSMIGVATVGVHMQFRRSFPGEGRSAALDPRMVACAVLVAAALVAMRRWPRVGFLTAAAGLIGYGLVGGPYMGLYLPAALATSVLVGRLGLRAAAPYFVAVPVMVACAGFASKEIDTEDLSTWRILFSGTIWTLLPALGVAVLSSRRQAALRERADALERAAANERLRLAREIHDVVGHSLSMISLQSGVALRVLDNDPAQVKASLEAIRGASKDALAELRHTLGVFRGDAGAFEADDAPRAPTPTIPAIAALVDDVRAGGVAVTLSPLPDAVGIGAAEQAAAYRIVQEALTNAVRHAAGEPVSVGIRRDPSTLVITVVNSLAAGAATPVIEGGGLRGMRERVVALGGTLEVERRPASFVVTAALPRTGRDA